MKRILSLLLFVLLFSCTNNANNNRDKDTVTAIDDTAAIEGSSPELVDKSQYYIWNANSDQKTLTRNPQLRPEYYSVDTLIMGLNERFPHVLLEKKSIGHDTLYTEIKDAQYLTEQMGSAGAEAYIAQAVLNLTAVKGIAYVRIDFAEGSHASPDVWSKASFENYKKVK